MADSGSKNLGAQRREYGRSRLDESDLPADPLVLFDLWMEEALASDQIDPTAMTLSTVDEQGQPASRIVLLKEVQAGRLLFFTNYQSRKSVAIGTGGPVAAHFYWPSLERQVKISGRAQPLEEAQSDHYFSSRPYESKIASWASAQSEVIPKREYLEREFENYRRKYPDPDAVPRPPHWGGYAISPRRMEFWQGGLMRLHDRMEYIKQVEGWIRQRLSP